jgi:hypothetical protein
VVQGGGRRDLRGAAGVGVGEAWGTAAVSGGVRGEKKEKERGEEREVLTGGPHCHLASTSAKPATKTIQW